MSIDHLLLYCPHTLLDAECTFLNAALAPLRIQESFRIAGAVVAFGTEQDNRFFWVSGISRDQAPIPDDQKTGVHIAFKAEVGIMGPHPSNVDLGQVQAFHKAALEAGGKDNGAPGMRKGYHPGYYGAFVISPGGHIIEAVVHDYRE